VSAVEPEDWTPLTRRLNPPAGEGQLTPRSGVPQTRIPGASWPLCATYSR
jgi:hypothetical protein